jgi:hypothetical protein
MTRAIAFLHAGDTNNVFKNNRCTWIGLLPSVDTPELLRGDGNGRDRNTGECVLFHGIETGLGAMVLSSTDTTVTVTFQ